MSAPSPTAKDTTPRLRLEGLQRLHVGPLHLALDGGECVSVMGASGSGKSVFLRMVADLDPHQGEAWLDGAACSAMRAPQWRKQVTYVPAESGWWNEYVAPHFPQDYDFALWLPQLGLDSAARDWPVSRLSTGERQRLALLRAVRPGCKVLLLDEPTSGLDPEAIEQVEQLLNTQRREHQMSILLVTHSQEQANRLADRQFRLHSGQLVAHDGAAS